MPAGSRLRPPALESLFVATFALLGLRLGLRPLGDNSLFVHLRTGIDMLRTGAIPRTDPYSFTAGGQPWVVQSWLAEASYGLAHRVASFEGVRMEHGVLYGLLAWLMARRARTGHAGRTALAAALVIGLGVVYWSPRPLAFGLVALAATVTIVEERRPPWLLLPVVWLWVNSHGSFVLGLAWLAAVAAGQLLDARAGRRPADDHEPSPRRPPVLPWLAAFVAGLGVAMVNPLGPRLVGFPFTVIDKRDAFRQVVEWRSPQFQTAAGLLTLGCLVVALLAIARARSLGWSDLLPVGGFLFMGLAAQRNLAMAAVVLAPVLGRALATRTGASSAAGPPDDRRPPLHLALAGALSVLAVVFTVGSTIEPALALDGYPVEAASLLRREGRLGRPTRLVTSDVAAGYLILVQGRQAGVFIDDRVDLYPVRTTLDYVRLLEGEPQAEALLDRYRVDAVLWPSKRALAGQLARSPGWRRLGARGGWVVFLRDEAGEPVR